MTTPSSSRSSSPALARRHRRRGRVQWGWMELASLTLGLALLTGFGAYDNLYGVKPTYYSIVVMGLIVGVLLLADGERIKRMVLPVPALLFIVWWLLSFLWCSDRPGYIKTMPKDLVAVLAVLLLGQLLPFERFVRVLWQTGLAALGLIFVALALHPGSAYVRYGAVPGLRGSFIHKNFMAPTFIFVTMVVLCYVHKPWIRYTTIVGTFVLMFLGKTSTGIATMGMVMLLDLVLRRWAPLLKYFGRAFGVAVIGLLLIATVSANSAVGYFLQLNGKDFTFSSRTLIWRGVVRAILKRPIAGWGWGVWANLFQEPAYSINRPLGFQVAVSHSAPLELLLRLGAVGLVLFLWQFVSTYRAGYALLRAGDPLGRLTLLFCLMVVIFGFSEAHVALGAWFGILCVLGALFKSRMRAVEAGAAAAPVTPARAPR